MMHQWHLEYKMYKMLCSPIHYLFLCKNTKTTFRLNLNKNLVHKSVSYSKSAYFLTTWGQTFKEVILLQSQTNSEAVYFSVWKSSERDPTPLAGEFVGLSNTVSETFLLCLHSNQTVWSMRQESIHTWFVMLHFGSLDFFLCKSETAPVIKA